MHQESCDPMRRKEGLRVSFCGPFVGAEPERHVSFVLRDLILGGSRPKIDFLSQTTRCAWSQTAKLIKVAHGDKHKGLWKATPGNHRKTIMLLFFIFF